MIYLIMTIKRSFDYIIYLFTFLFLIFSPLSLPAMY